MSDAIRGHSTVGPKYQITIPKAVREHLNIATGIEVEVAVGADGIVVRPVDRKPGQWSRSTAQVHYKEKVGLLAIVRGGKQRRRAQHRRSSSLTRRI